MATEISTTGGVRVHPAQYFISYLLLVAENPALDGINAALRVYGLAPCTTELYAQLRDALGTPPERFSCADPGHRASAEYLRKHRVFSLIHPDAPVLEMQDKILGNPVLRDRIDILLFGRVQDSKIAAKLGSVDVSISALAVAEYRHYFWNVSLLSIRDWEEYFASDERTGKSSVQRGRLSSALLSGQAVAFHRAGIEQELDSHRILLEVEAELYATFLEVKDLPVSMEKVAMLGQLTRSLARVDERKKVGDGALAAILKRFEKFKMVRDDVRAPTLAELAPRGSVSHRSKEDIIATSRPSGAS